MNKMQKIVTKKLFRLCSLIWYSNNILHRIGTLMYTRWDSSAGSSNERLKRKFLWCAPENPKYAMLNMKCNDDDVIVWNLSFLETADHHLICFHVFFSKRSNYNHIVLKNHLALSSFVIILWLLSANFTYVALCHISSFKLNDTQTAQKASNRPTIPWWCFNFGGIGFRRIVPDLEET